METAGLNQHWSPEAHELAKQARAMNALKLEGLVQRLQRHTGRSRRDCLNFVHKYLSSRPRQRPWTEEEIQRARELLAVHPVKVVANKLNRTTDALRMKCKRLGIRTRELQCDLFSITSLASELRIRKEQVRELIAGGFLEASQVQHCDRSTYKIDPEAVSRLLIENLPELERRRVRSSTILQVYERYCYTPKHTTDKQLLQVREAKRERAAYEAQSGNYEC
jgi:hypothetical protein